MFLFHNLGLIHTIGTITILLSAIESNIVLLIFGISYAKCIVILVFCYDRFVVGMVCLLVDVVVSDWFKIFKLNVLIEWITAF